MIIEELKQQINRHPSIKTSLMQILVFIKWVYSYTTQYTIKLFVLPFLRRPNFNKKYKVSICGMFKDEGPFLKEWIEYHLLVGIDHFYLYNNNSSDNYKEVLEPYIAKEIVTLIEWPYDHSQMKCYKHFHDTYRHETTWYTYLDIDEFFCLRENITISEWLNYHKRYPVIFVNWLMFGTSGHMEHDYTKFVMEQYTNCWGNLDSCGKCLINSDYELKKFDGMVHHEAIALLKIFGMKVSIRPFTQWGGIYKGQNDNNRECFDIEKATIWINHYWSKAWDIYDRKRKKTDVIFKNNPKADLKYFYFHENRNVSSNYVILRHLMEMKIKINNIK